MSKRPSSKFLHRALHFFVMACVLSTVGCDDKKPPQPSAEMKRWADEGMERINQAMKTDSNVAPNLPRRNSARQEEAVFETPCRLQLGPDKDHDGEPDHCQSLPFDTHRVDSDGDGTPDFWEPCAADRDCDHDGIPNKDDKRPLSSSYDEKRYIENKQNEQRQEEIRQRNADEQKRQEAQQLEKQLEERRQEQRRYDDRRNR